MDSMNRLSKNQLSKKLFFWVVLGGLTYGMDMVFHRYTQVYETVYFRGVFQGIRVVYDYLVGWIPVPMFYIVLIFFSYIIFSFLKYIFYGKEENLWRKIKGILLRLLAFIGGFIFFFYNSWGYNYNQMTLAERLNLTSTTPDSLSLFSETQYLTYRLDSLRKLIVDDTSSIDKISLPKGMEDTIRNHLTGILASWDLPTWGKVRVRTLYPKGILLRMSSAGIYVPFVFEGSIDGGLHPIQIPYVMAHEMTHGYGITDEGSCNFVAYLTCIEDENPIIQYSGLLGVWRYFYYALGRHYPSLHKKLKQNISLGIIKDLRSIRREMLKYPDITPIIHDVLYDRYLRSHGVKGGVKNYNSVIPLEMAWRRRQDKALQDEVEK